MSVEKKVALVTGSTSGIGLACSHALAKHGINIIATGSRDASLVSAILDDIKRFSFDSLTLFDFQLVISLAVLHKIVIGVTFHDF
jgi:NAD(P)-dependent dehydrogenase (short-subunit alcohol dehydrogenase family)